MSSPPSADVYAAYVVRQAAARPVRTSMRGTMRTKRTGARRCTLSRGASGSRMLAMKDFISKPSHQKAPTPPYAHHRISTLHACTNYERRKRRCDVHSFDGSTRPRRGLRQASPRFFMSFFCVSNQRGRPPILSQRRCSKTLLRHVSCPGTLSALCLYVAALCMHGAERRTNTCPWCYKSI